MPQRLGELVVHLGQVRRLDLLHRHQEVGRLAGDVLAVVVGREGQREGLALAGLHAAHGILEFLEHLALADQELEGLCLAALEGLAIDLAFEVHRHAVAFLRRGVLRPLGEGAALLAQDVQRLVDGGFAHLRGLALDLGLRQVRDLHLGIDLEHGVERELALGRAVLLRDPGLARHAQLGFVRRRGKGLADLVVHDLVVHRVAIALRHDVHRHLAGRKPSILTVRAKRFRRESTSDLITSTGRVSVILRSSFSRVSTVTDMVSLASKICVVRGSDSNRHAREGVRT